MRTVGCSTDGHGRVAPAAYPGLTRAARAFTAGVPGPGHPCRDDAALLVSELFGNSVAA